ncbi:hypothetical protein SLA2020_445490 [Shorea laevis]
MWWITGCYLLSLQLHPASFGGLELPCWKISLFRRLVDYKKINMVQTLEAIKGGGGSIRVGATGTISSLMTRELDSIKSSPQMPVSFRGKHGAVPVSDPCGAAAPKRVQPRKSSDEASSSSCIDHRSPEITRKTKNYTRNTHRIPMLGSDSIALDRTPIREKTEKKGTNIVEIVDIKCGNQDRVWANPITNRLKKMGFSKLSESII